MFQYAGLNVPKLPYDHHELMAMIAPRALLVTGNTDFFWLSNPSCYVSARAAHEVWKQFGIGDRHLFGLDGLEQPDLRFPFATLAVFLQQVLVICNGIVNQVIQVVLNLFDIAFEALYLRIELFYVKLVYSSDRLLR